MKKLLFQAAMFVASLSLMSASCKKDNSDVPPVVEDKSYNFGTSVKLADGTAKAFIKHDAAGIPLEVGIAISEAAMNTLPHTNADLALELPTSHAKMPYKFVYLN